MMSLGFKRCLAFLVDYVLIALYVFVLFMAFYPISDMVQTTINGSAAHAQLLGFGLLTLPTLLYFILSETSIHRASIGKRLLKIRVVNPDNRTHRVLIRNLIKFLPWEIAHTGVYQSFYADPSTNPAIETILLLTVPQVVVMAYVLGIFADKGRTAFYDTVAGTSVEVLQDTLKTAPDKAL
jgi:uncharacterized RDD family membrane protein YckC